MERTKEKRVKNEKRRKKNESECNVEPGENKRSISSGNSSSQSLCFRHHCPVRSTCMYDCFCFRNVVSFFIRHVILAFFYYYYYSFLLLLFTLFFSVVAVVVLCIHSDTFLNYIEFFHFFFHFFDSVFYWSAHTVRVQLISLPHS